MRIPCRSHAYTAWSKVTNNWLGLVRIPAPRVSSSTLTNKYAGTRHGTQQNNLDRARRCAYMWIDRVCVCGLLDTWTCATTPFVDRASTARCQAGPTGLSMHACMQLGRPIIDQIDLSLASSRLRVCLLAAMLHAPKKLKTTWPRAHTTGGHAACSGSFGAAATDHARLINAIHVCVLN